MLSFGSIMLIIMSSLSIIYYLVRTVISAVKAKKEGIVRTVYPFKAAELIILAAGLALFALFIVFFASKAKPYSDFLNDLNARGTAPLAEYYGASEVKSGSDIPEEQEPLLLSNAKKYCEHEIQHYMDKIVFAIVFAIELIAIAATDGAFITKSGKVYFMVRNVERGASYEAFACVKGRKIRFYYEDEPEKTLFKLAATDKNLELYKDFIRPILAENTELVKRS